MLTRQQVRDVCAAFASQGWWVEGDIPAKRLENAREHWRQPPQGDVIAFLDSTLLGSGKDGLAVTDEGIGWESGANSTPRCSYGWRELAGVPIRVCGRLLQIGSGALNTAGQAMDAGYLATCLRQLQQLALDAGAPRAPAHVPEGRSFPAAGQPPAGGEALQSLLEALAGDWLHVAPEIPARKERNARERMRIPPEELVLALADTTVFRSGKDGVVVAARGIYWRNSAVDGGNENGRLTWEALARTRVALAAGLVMLGEQDWVKPDVGHAEDTERLLLGVQWWARARMPPEQRQAALAAAGEAEPAMVVPASDEPRWHLAVDGQRFGPYDTTHIGLMAAAGQVNADTAYAWAEGMAAWTPLRQVPELAAVLPVAPPPVVPAAPTPVQAAPAAEAGERVDINSAPVDDLLALPGMTRARAELLVKERGARGGFRDVEQVGQLLGLQPHQVERMRGMVIFGRAATPRGRLVDF
jgi:DNA uptake protein ComE-like DNA-binding protein